MLNKSNCWSGDDLMRKSGWLVNNIQATASQKSGIKKKRRKCRVRHVLHPYTTRAIFNITNPKHFIPSSLFIYLLSFFLFLFNNDPSILNCGLRQRVNNFLVQYELMLMIECKWIIAVLTTPRVRKYGIELLPSRLKKLFKSSLVHLITIQEDTIYTNVGVLH